MEMPAPGVFLVHKKSKDFVSEVVDQTHVITMQASDGGTQFAITFSRDVLDVEREVFKTGQNPGELVLTIDQKDVAQYRMQMMQAVLPFKAAKGFALSLLKSINDLEASMENADTGKL